MGTYAMSNDVPHHKLTRKWKCFPPFIYMIFMIIAWSLFSREAKNIPCLGRAWREFEHERTLHRTSLEAFSTLLTEVKNDCCLAPMQSDDTGWTGSGACSTPVAAESINPRIEPLMTGARMGINTHFSARNMGTSTRNFIQYHDKFLLS